MGQVREIVESISQSVADQSIATKTAIIGTGNVAPMYLLAQDPSPWLSLKVVMPTVVSVLTAIYISINIYKLILDLRKRKKVKVSRFKVEDHLDSDEVREAYLEAMQKLGGEERIKRAKETIARSKQN